MTGKQSLLQFHRRTRLGRHWIVGVVALLLFAACDRPRGGQNPAEIDEQIFRRGQRLLSSNKPAALEEFQKVIDKRGGDAPESHLEAGRIYLDHFRDHVAAIYHFRRYRALKPNGTYANQVAQMIDTAEKEYTRKLAGNPLEAQNDRIELLDQIERLKRQVAERDAEIDRLNRSGRGGVAGGGQPAGNITRPTAPGATVNVPNVAPAPMATTGWPAALPEESPAPYIAPVAPDFPVATGNVTSPAPASTGSYVVQKGDTLVAISRKVYGSASHWRAIYEANRDRIPDVNVLRIGTELRLP